MKCLGWSFFYSYEYMVFWCGLEYGVGAGGRGSGFTAQRWLSGVVVSGRGGRCVGVLSNYGLMSEA